MKVGAVAGVLLLVGVAAAIVWTSTHPAHHRGAAPPRTAAPHSLPTLAEGALPCSTKQTVALTEGLVEARGDTYAALAGVHAGTVQPRVLADAIGDWMTAVTDARRCLGPRAAITQNRAIGRVLLQVQG
jgi:hypothetical protein